MEERPQESEINICFQTSVGMENCKAKTVGKKTVKPLKKTATSNKAKTASNKSPISNQEGVLKRKISQFIAEVGDRKLSKEQQKVYSAFTKTSGSNVFLHLTDSDGKQICLKIVQGRKDTGSKHILMKHYKTKKYYVTAEEILNLGEIIRNGKHHESRSYTVYTLKNKTLDGVISEAIKIEKDCNNKAILKSLYSNRYLEKEKPSRPACSSHKRGCHR